VDPDVSDRFVCCESAIALVSFVLVGLGWSFSTLILGRSRMLSDDDWLSVGDSFTGL